MDQLSAGTVIGGEFRVERLLAVGGMGEVYLARHLAAETSVFALKVLSADLVRSQRSIERFKNELRAVQKIDHPNVMRAHGYLSDGGCHALILEYVDGLDLTSLPQRDRLAPSDVLDLLTQVTAGLRAIHAAGIIHRDLKPDNIIIRRDGVVKISDFGVARLDTGVTLTPMGGMVGTARYLAPEYLETGDCDARGDLFALGVIGYELLTRVSPFGTDDRLQVLMARHRAPVTPIRELAPSVPRELAQVVERAMSRKVTQRFLSAESLYQALVDLQRGDEWE
jgi:serine/threonine-protein kinase